jgi:hypothetical protein
MVDRYQTLDNYTGELTGGISYDYEIPNDIVVETGGGVDGIHHSNQTNFTGIGNTYIDRMSGQGPNYLSGAYGNLYSTGGQTTPTEPKLWESMPPKNDDIEFLEPVNLDKLDASNIPDEVKTTFRIKTTPSAAIIMFLLLIFLFFLFDMFSASGQLFIQEKFNEGKEFTWQRMLFIAIAGTAIFVLLVYMFGYQISTFEVL